MKTCFLMDSVCIHYSVLEVCSIHSAKQKFLGTSKSPILTEICQIKSISGEADIFSILIPNFQDSDEKFQSSNHLNKDRYVLKIANASHSIVYK